MAEPALPPAHVVAPEPRSFDPPEGAAGEGLVVRTGRVRRLPNGDLVQAHRYDDELARLRAEASMTPL